MMKFRFQIREAFINLKVSKLRSFLAVLGILVGTASVVAMISGGELATREVLLQFKSLGTNLLALQVYDNQSGAGAPSVKKKLTYPLIQKFNGASPNITRVAAYTNVFAPITFGDKIINGTITGATEDLAAIVKLNVAQGRFVGYLDGYQHFAAIGNGIYQEIKRDTVKDPIGQQLQLGNQLFTIIGVLKPWKSNPFIFEDLNNSVIVPIQTSTLLSKDVTINNIIMRLKQGANIQQTQDAITTFLNRYSPGKQVYFRSAAQLIEHMKNQQNILTIFLAFIGGISLLVGGIGVMNIMLVSITERRREIGIRKAIGAKHRDIESLFLIESIILSLFGGISGVIIGVIISFLIAVIKDWEFTLFWLPIIIGFGVSVGVGIFFGFYPAYKASKLDPIEALHAE